MEDSCPRARQGRAAKRRKSTAHGAICGLPDNRIDYPRRAERGCPLKAPSEPARIVRRDPKDCSRVLFL
jgi:hypothetical protein